MGSGWLVCSPYDAWRYSYFYVWKWPKPLILFEGLFGDSPLILKVAVSSFRHHLYPWADMREGAKRAPSKLQQSPPRSTQEKPLSRIFSSITFRDANFDASSVPPSRSTSDQKEMRTWRIGRMVSTRLRKLRKKNAARIKIRSTSKKKKHEKTYTWFYMLRRYDTQSKSNGD